MNDKQKIFLMIAIPCFCLWLFLPVWSRDRVDGHYVPGTRIPILPEADLYDLDNQNEPILNLAWHIPGEVRANLVLNGYKGEVLDIKAMNAG